MIQGINIYSTELFNNYADSFTIEYPETIKKSFSFDSDYQGPYYYSIPDIKPKYNTVNDAISKLGDFRLVKKYIFNIDRNDDEANQIADMSSLLDGDDIVFPNDDILETLPAINYEQEYAPSIDSFKKINIYNNKLIGIGNQSLPALKNLPHSIATDAETSGSKRGLSYSFTFEIVEPVTGEIKVVTAKNGDYGEWWNFQKLVL